MELLGIELSYEEFDKLMCEQSNGKELKVVDGKVVAVDHVATDEEKRAKHIVEIKERLALLSEDFIQATVGAQFTDLNSRINEFRALHNELRVLQGKTPREYK